MPWSGSAPPFGFGPTGGQPWIPQPAEWSELTVAAQAADPASTLAFYRAALAARRTFSETAGEGIELVEAGTDVVCFRRGPITVALNCGTEPVALPPGEVLIASGPVGEKLPPDTAAWLG